MEIKTKLIKLESSGYRYIFSTLWIFYSLIRMQIAYQRYAEYISEYPDIAQGYLRFFYFHLAVVVMMVAFLIFFGIVDSTIKNKDKHLILKDGTLFIPNSITNKIKEIRLEDIDNIGYEGFTDDKVKINMKTTKYIFAPRIYNVFDKDLKSIYNIINELLVMNYSKNN